MLKSLLMVTSEGHVKFAHYFTSIDFKDRPSNESRICEMCLRQPKDSCHFLVDNDQMVIFRWFGPCLLIAAADFEENELFVYEFLNLYVSILHKYFGKFSEKHILFNVDKLHMVLEEMVVNGEIVESSSKNVLAPLLMLDKLNS